MIQRGKKEQRLPCRGRSSVPTYVSLQSQGKSWGIFEKLTSMEVLQHDDITCRISKPGYTRRLTKVHSSGNSINFINPVFRI